MGGPTETSTAPGREAATATATATATPPPGQGGALGRLRPPSVWRSSDTVGWAERREDLPGHSRSLPLRGLGIAPNTEHRFHPVQVVHIEHGPHISRSWVRLRGRLFTSFTVPQRPHLKGVNRQRRRPPSRPALRLPRVCWAASATPPPSRGKEYRVDRQENGPVEVLVEMEARRAFRALQVDRRRESDSRPGTECLAPRHRWVCCALVVVGSR
jgi:hypothetical protein